MTVAVVTGGHGFVGVHLRRILSERGWEVVSIGRRPRESAVGEVYHAVDLVSADGLTDLLASVRPDVVFHLAATTRQRAAGDDTILADGILATYNLCAAIRRTGRRTRLVLAGSSAEYGPVPMIENPITEETRCRAADAYGLSKLAAEATTRAMAADGALEFLAARAFNHVGPGESRSTVAGSLAARVSAVAAGIADVIEVENLDVVRDFTDVRDVAAGYVSLAERGVSGEVYNLCSGRPVTIGEVLDGLLNAVGLDRGVIRAIPAPHPAVPYQVGSSGRARRETGWEPTIELQASLSDLLASIGPQRLGETSADGAQ